MSPRNDTITGYQVLLQPIQVQEHAAAELVASGNVSTFRLWVERGWMPAGTKLGKYRYWLVTDLVKAAETLHHRGLPPDPEKKVSKYAEAQKKARRLSRGR